MKKYYFFGIAALIVLLGVGMLFFTDKRTSDDGKTPESAEESGDSPSNATDTETQQKTTTSATKNGKTTSSTSNTAGLKTQGRIIFALKDEFVSIDQIDSILLTVNKIEVQSPTKGWVTVMEGPRVYDLIKIYKSGIKEFLSESYLDPGTYNQIRMDIGVIRVIKRGSDTPEEAKLPSGELKIPARIQIAKGENSSVEIDVLSEKSLHTASDGTLIFLPVLRVETKSNVTSFQVRQNMVTIIGGADVYDATFGMDENGNLKDGYRLSPSTKLEIVDGKIRIIPK